MSRRLVGLGMSVLMLAACGQGPDSQPPMGTVAGHVFQVACPGTVPREGQYGCSRRLVGSATIVFTPRASGSAVRVVSGPGGAFNVSLAPGLYAVALHGAGIIGDSFPVMVSVAAGQAQSVDLTAVFHAA